MTEQFTFGGEIVWKPTPEHIEHANLTAFMRTHGIKDFDELMHRSTTDVAWFTDAVFKFLDIQFYEPYTKVVDLSDGIQFPKWCVDGKMNIVHNCVDKWQNAESGKQKAVVFEGEEGSTRTLTYEELYKEVNKTANALRSLGLGQRRCNWYLHADDPGDRHRLACYRKDRRNYPSAFFGLRRGCHRLAHGGCGCESALRRRWSISARQACRDEIHCG
jgi:hypothetical protein